MLVWLKIAKHLKQPARPRSGGVPEHAFQQIELATFKHGQAPVPGTSLATAPPHHDLMEELHCRSACSLALAPSVICKWLASRQPKRWRTSQGIPHFNSECRGLGALDACPCTGWTKLVSAPTMHLGPNILDCSKGSVQGLPTTGMWMAATCSNIALWH